MANNGAEIYIYSLGHCSHFDKPAGMFQVLTIAAVVHIAYSLVSWASLWAASTAPAKF